MFKQKVIICITGKNKVGKDTAAQILYNSLCKLPNIHNINKCAIADPLKHITIDLINLFYQTNIDIDTLNYYKDEKRVFNRSILLYNKNSKILLIIIISMILYAYGLIFTNIYQLILFMLIYLLVPMYLYNKLFTIRTLLKIIANDILKQRLDKNIFYNQVVNKCDSQINIITDARGNDLYNLYGLFSIKYSRQNIKFIIINIDRKIKLNESKSSYVKILEFFKIYEHQDIYDEDVHLSNFDLSSGKIIIYNVDNNYDLNYLNIQLNQIIQKIKLFL